MRHVRKLFAFALTLVMAFAMCATAFAAVDANTITVNGLEAGDTVQYYKVIEWQSDGWHFTSSFDSVLTDSEKNQIIAVPEGHITDETAAKMAGAAAEVAGNNGGSVATGATSWSESNLDPGLYMVLITDDASAGAMHVYNPVFLAVQANNAGSEVTLPSGYANDGTAKKSDITVDKLAKSAGENEQWAEATSEDVGDIIDFKVETTVPAYLDSWSNPSFTVTDTISPGLTLAVNDGEGDAALTAVTVSGETTGAMDAGTQYTIVFNKNADGKAIGYTITFTNSYLKDRKAAEKVTITYNAKITAEATNVNPETNTVKIEYSNDPNNANGHGSKEDKTTHYTFSIDADLYGGENYKTSELVKVGVDAAGNPVTAERTYDNGSKHSPLQGAEFKLYTDAACTTAYTNSTIKENTKFTTDENGKLNISGLDEGTYYLKETTAATGYMLLQNPVQFKIEASYKTVEATETCNSYKELSGYTVKVYVNDTLQATSNYTINQGTITKTETGAAGDQSYEIQNTKGQSLPSTGGIGTTIFYIVGGVMVAGAAIFLLTKRRVTAE